MIELLIKTVLNKNRNQNRETKTETEKTSQSVVNFVFVMKFCNRNPIHLTPCKTLYKRMQAAYETLTVGLYLVTIWFWRFGKKKLEKKKTVKRSRLV